MKTRPVLHHAPAAPPPPIADLPAAEVRLRTAGAAREQALQGSLEAERTRDERMDRKFDELPRRGKQAPDDRPVKDIDL